MKFNIAGYCRISVDEELDRDNTSIENQKSIIKDYVSRKFPDSTLDLYEDRDRSGYTFEQREGYQQLRAKMMSRDYDILVVKDFSRFSRRNSKGLVELEDLRDAGMRIISINDSIDYPTYDDWTAIQFRFLINEMPVTDASKKVKSVIKRRQEEGKWICSVPYGYVMTNTKMMKFEVDEVQAQVVRRIFELYNKGWGYKKIANYLTAQHVPTPRMDEITRKEAKGEECRLVAKKEWSIQTIAEILCNDFYIGTLRQKKYRRKKINGSDEKLLETENIVFKDNHQPIVDPRLFTDVQEIIRNRHKCGYNGVRKYANPYSGYLFCGDCGAPMFAMSRPNLAPAYRCGSYQKLGKHVCSSHHIRVDVMDGVIKEYLGLVRNNSEGMIKQLQESIKSESEDSDAGKKMVRSLEDQIAKAKSEINMLIRQKARDIIKHPERADTIEEVYDEQIDDLTTRIEGLKNQLKLAEDKQGEVRRLNQSSRTVFDVFDSIINKEHLDKQDIGLIVDKIIVFKDMIEIQLKSDIDRLLRIASNQCNAEKEKHANFHNDTEQQKSSLIASRKNFKGDVLSVNTISDGEPLEIYTSSDGEVIFKKYSPIGELSDSAVQAAEVIAKLGNAPAVVFDNDHVVAVSGASKREYSQRRLSPALEEILRQRKSYEYTAAGNDTLYPVEGVRAHALAVAPIISNGDVSGAVAFVAEKDSECATMKQALLAKTAALFLGKQIEE